MRNATLYRTTLSRDTFDYSLSAGDHQLTITLLWPEPEQEQWDDFSRRLTNMSRSDPIITKDRTLVSRTYDYIKYYTETVPRQMVDREAWWELQTEAPQSLYGKTYEQIASILEDRVILAQGQAIYKEELEEALHYQVIIVDEMQRKIVGDLIPGGWINCQDEYWALRFIADVDSIARDRLYIVTVEVEVYG